MKNKLIIFIILILITIPVIFPFFQKGYFPTHDGEWAVVRMADMFRSLRDQQFPVRVSGFLNFGYGYPLFNFAYPAPYYMGTLLHFVKFGFVDSVKFLFAISVIVSALSMYLLSYELWRSNAAGIISVIFYIYLPYRIVDLYARGSVGESLSFALFPLILFFILKIIKKPKQFIYIALGALSYAFLIMTHNIMAVLFTPVMLIFVLYNIYQSTVLDSLSPWERVRVRGKNILLFLLLSFGLSAFFWVPALSEKQNILLSRIPIANRDSYFVSLEQLIVPRWGYGLPDHTDGFSYQIGLAHLGILVTLIIYLIYDYLIMKNNINNRLIIFAGILGITLIAYILLMFSITKVIWVYTPLLKEINYPWTLLAPVGFLISLISGFLVIQNKPIKYLVIILAFISIIFILPHAKPESVIDKGDYYYLTNDATTTSSQELMPLWVKKLPNNRPANKAEIINGKGTITNQSSNSKSINFETELQTESKVAFNTIFYPGWVVEIDGKNADISHNNPNGLMEINLTKGHHIIKANFIETPLRQISNFISLLSLFSIIIILFLGLREKYYK